MIRTNTILLIAAFAIFILAFGCVGGPNQTTTQTQTNPQTTAQNQESQTTQETIEQILDQTEQEQTTQEQPVQGQATNDLTGLTYNQLLGRGVPIECDIVSRTETGTVTMKMYYDGSAKSRVEFETAQNTGRDSCQRMAIISQNMNSADIGCISGQAYMANCNWLHMEFEQSEVEDVERSVSTPSGTPDYTRLPPTSYNCRPWIVDNSKFQTSGRVCTMEDLTAGYPTGAR